MVIIDIQKVYLKIQVSIQVLKEVFTKGNFREGLNTKERRYGVKGVKFILLIQIKSLVNIPTYCVPYSSRSCIMD